LAVDQPWSSTDVVDRWRQNAARRARSLGPATERMLDVAGLQPGQRVLDLAAGTGDQTLLVARRVLPGGSVLAVDISATMLAGAEEAAREAGLSNIETLVSDGSQLQLASNSFDVAICRMGLMFMPDVGRALGNVRTALKPNSKFAALVWSLAERNPSMSIPIDVVREQRGLPEGTRLPIMNVFSLAEPGVLEHALGDAGFKNAHVEAVSVPRHSASLDAAMEAVTALGDLLREVPAAERESIEREVRQRFSAYTQPDGAVDMPGEAWLGYAEC